MKGEQIGPVEAEIHYLDGRVVRGAWPLTRWEDGRLTFETLRMPNPDGSFRSLEFPVLPGELAAKPGAPGVQCLARPAMEQEATPQRFEDW
jgi:hypothetical protein